MPDAPARLVAVVAHTHWDREWYAPFEVYRSRLVEVLDAVVGVLGSDPGFVQFHLDGQVAMVDDYLDLRPDAEPGLRRLIAGGRISVGPWYVLPDEFAVSAETLVRNLELGWDRAAALGADPSVGYLPDMFGHVAQMPQILRQAGLGAAVVWRGVPAAVGAAAFEWEAPDGSAVAATYLPVGYANGAFLPKDAGALVRRVAAHEREVGAFLRPGWPLLLMNGGDHQYPQAWLPALLDAANATQTDYRFVQMTLEEYTSLRLAGPRPRWRGELRSGWRAPLLMGVHSNRVDVKQAAAGAEAVLERRAEPLAALWLPPELWPAAMLDRAWRQVVLNSAHDSVCACSVDPVVRAVLVRYEEATALGEQVAERALAIAGVATAAAGPVVVNSLAHERGGVVELVLSGTTAPEGTQPVSAQEPGTETRTGTGADLARLLGELAADGWLGGAGRPVSARLGTAPDGGTDLTLVADESAPPDPEVAPVMAEAWATAGSRPDATLRVTVQRTATRRVLAPVTAVPGWGWRVWSAGPAPEPVRVGADLTVGNGLVSLRVSSQDGTFALDGTAGLNALVDEGDAGDTYNFSGVPGEEAVGGPAAVGIEVVERGPVRATVRIVRHFDWPAHLDGGTRAGSVPTVVTTVLTVLAGDPAVRVSTWFDNGSRDHRVRAVFPLPDPATAAEAECAFASVSRTGAEGGRMEAALPTFPSRRFVSAGGLTITHRGLTEYELVDEGRSLAVTLLRSVGILARPAPPARPNAAGPAEPVDDAQMPGRRRFDLAVAVGHPNPWRLADEVWTPLEVVRGQGIGHLADSGSRLRFDGAEVSSLRRRDGALEVRVFNPTTGGREVRIPGQAGSLVDLRGRETGRWSGSFGLGPMQFATARLDARSLDPVTGPAQ